MYPSFQFSISFDIVREPVRRTFHELKHVRKTFEHFIYCIIFYCFASFQVVLLVASTHTNKSHLTFVESTHYDSLR